MASFSSTPSVPSSAPHPDLLTATIEAQRAVQTFRERYSLSHTNAHAHPLPPASEQHMHTHSPSAAHPNTNLSEAEKQRQDECKNEDKHHAEPQKR